MVVYCHFSFRRRNNNSYGLFAVAMYKNPRADKRSCIMHLTRKYDLWVPEDCYVTAIQAYEHVLKTIYETQHFLRKHGVEKIYLVCDNSSLVKWVCNPAKAKERAPYMERAVENYRLGARNEIIIPIGMCNPVRTEKSYKYCKDEYVTTLSDGSSVACADGKRRIDISGMQVMTLDDIERSNIAKPEILGIQEDVR